MIDIGTLRAEIADRGFGWEPTESSILELSGSGSTDALLGVRVAPEVAMAQVTLARALPPAKYDIFPPPPRRSDWRTNGGKNFVTPVRNQGDCGSCVAFATVAVVESRLAIQANKPSPTTNLSEAHLYFCSGRTCSQGWWPEFAMDAARTRGIAAEKDFPYPGADTPCPTPAPPPVAAVTGWDTPQRFIHRKQAIAFNGPVVAVLKVYEDFLQYGSGVYRHVLGDFAGLHAVAVVGFDDDQECWIIKNSWSSQWGENGFGRIHYDECGIDRDYLFWDPYVSPYVPALVNAVPHLADNV